MLNHFQCLVSILYTEAYDPHASCSSVLICAAWAESLACQGPLNHGMWLAGHAMPSGHWQHQSLAAVPPPPVVHLGPAKSSAPAPGSRDLTCTEASVCSWTSSAGPAHQPAAGPVTPPCLPHGKMGVTPPLDPWPLDSQLPLEHLLPDLSDLPLDLGEMLAGPCNPGRHVFHCSGAWCGLSGI